LKTIAPVATQSILAVPPSAVCQQIAGGTRITFVVPDAIESGGEAPPVRVITGSYPVQVETSLGKSNVLMLRVFR
jgi:hypothetical protein